jgi:drug/metabolite transporter (DMT)-like permease
MSVPTNSNIVMKPREWALLIILSILWGGSFFFVEVALVDLPPLTLVLGRVGIAAAALLLMVRCLDHHMPRDRRAWGAFVIMGALNNLIPFCLIVWGQTHIASGLAAILNATTPLFTVVLAHFLTHDEKMTPMRLIGVLIGLAGVTVMFGAQVLAGLGLDSVAQIAVLGAAVSYACAGLFGRRFRGTPPLVTAAGQLTATTVLMLPMALIIDRPWTLALPSFTTWAAIIALALLCTATAYVLYFRILAAAGATNLLLVTFLVPVSAIVLGVSVLGERLEPEQLAGMALIGLGLAAIDGRLLKRPRRRFPRPSV